MNWDDVAERLYDACVVAIESFAAAHGGERFYGFALDVNADYGEVLLCFNTAADLKTTRAKHYPDWSDDEVAQRLRWSVGDWRYHAFNLGEPYAAAWSRAWQQTQENIADAILDEEDQEEDPAEAMLITAAVVAVQLETNQAFDAVPREPGFRALAIGHEDFIEAAWQRMDAVRAELKRQ